MSKYFIKVLNAEVQLIHISGTGMESIRHDCSDVYCQARVADNVTEQTKVQEEALQC